MENPGEEHRFEKLCASTQEAALGSHRFIPADPSANSRTSRPGFLRRIGHYIIGVLCGRWFRRAKPVPAPSIILPHALKAPPVVFKGNTARVVITPVGGYAGGPYLQDMRRVAEQQFHRIESSHGATIN